MTQPLRRAAFLDRDGVINRDHGYVGRWEDFEFLPGAIEGMRMLQDAGYVLIVVTNQSGIARGYYTEADFGTLTRKMLDTLHEQGVHVTAVYHCPHHPQGTVAELAIECDCRKPAPGMLLRAAKEHSLLLPDSVMIGDKLSDLIAAQRAGVGRLLGVRLYEDHLAVDAATVELCKDLQHGAGLLLI
jgi:D-glycero-D-manno-heptose 1,7-bisphosphate phosphatase